LPIPASTSTLQVFRFIFTKSFASLLAEGLGWLS